MNGITIGQIMPGDTQYNFSGEIDDVRVYNRALSDAEVAELVGIVTAVDDPSQSLPATSGLKANYPNPLMQWSKRSLTAGETESPSGRSAAYD